MSKFTTLLIGLVSIIMCSPHAFSAQLPHAHIASPNHYEVLLDNSEVLVLRMTLAPGEQDNWHTHNAETVYFETGGKATISTKESQTTLEIPNGYVMWHDAWTHQVKNEGETTITAIIVESK